MDAFEIETFNLGVSMLEDRLISLTLDLNDIKRKMLSNQKVLISQDNVLINHSNEIIKRTEKELCDYFSFKIM